MQKWIMASLLGIASILAIVLIITGLPQKTEVAEEEPSFVVPEIVANVDEAKQVYQSMCLSCHGADMQGGMGPSLAQIGATKSKEQLYTIISEGQRGMPAFHDRLTEDELVNIVTWLSTLQ